MMAASVFSRMIVTLSLALPLFSVYPSKAESDNANAIELTDWVIEKSNGEIVPIDTSDSWESVMGVEFDGTATYRTKMPNLESNGKRILIHFEAVATHATVKIDGKLIGEHIGGWTPFQFDVTDSYKPDGLIEVTVQELPGHNTQGFLPVFIPHFGGIWGKVKLQLVPNTAFIEKLSLLGAGWESDRVRFQFSINRVPDFSDTLSVGVKADASENWHWCELPRDEQMVALELNGDSIKDWPIWSPDHPIGTECEIVLRNDSTGKIIDRHHQKVYRRKVETVGKDIVVNGKPISIRGVLNWGYAPPRLCPSRDRDWMREELEFIKARGFNTMKFCLWIPPREYLELCDEMGIFAWVEYPTWHPKLTQQYLPQLLKEYEEFFQYDRNHPSVILRSLTCETGHSAELEVIQQIYDKAHSMIPGALVEDDSSWISWQRVHDFYDDHPYGNNHKWQGVLQGLDDYINQREPKPLVLGEAIAADTWADASVRMPESPHALISHPNTRSTEQKIAELVGGASHWKEASYTHAFETRKFQIERFRHQLPRQGYNVSVIRDFPFASMGLIDFENKAKTTSEQWRWHREQMICLETSKDCRSFFAGTKNEISFHLLEPQPGQHKIEWSVDGILQPVLATTIKQNNVSKWTIPTIWQPAANVTSPRAVTLAVRWYSDNRVIAENEWKLWVVPSMGEAASLPKMVRHDSFDASMAEKSNLLKDLEAWQPNESEYSTVVVARAFDARLWKWLNEGGMVLMLPDGRVGSLPVLEHWFLRGGPIVNHTAYSDPSLSKMIESLQAFDLAGPVMPKLDIIDEIEPLVLLWDNHDIRDYRLHACSWGANVGQGRILVSTLEFDVSRGAATQAFVADAVQRLVRGPFSKSLERETIQRMESDLTSELTEVPRNGWSFKPDKSREGKSNNWHSIAPDETWGAIRIAEHWDGQGHQGLDGWAWYSKSLAIPEDANYMIFNGVDDYFEVFIDGVEVGSGGDLANRKTAFEMVVPIKIPANKRGEQRVAILVDDWQGAGGIFRKVYFSSELPSSKPAILQRKTTQSSR